MNAKRGYRLSQLAERTRTRLVGEDLIVDGVGSVAHARPGQITFLHDEKHRPQLAATQASAVIMHSGNGDDAELPRLLSDNPLLTFARVAGLFHPADSAAGGVHSRAQLADDCHIGDNVSIAAGCVIGSGARIGDDCALGANCFVADKCVIGARSRIGANAVIRAQARLGREVYVHSGAIIGSDGFGFAQDGQSWVRIPQCGSVRIGDAVEVGANTVIDRGALDDTIIEDGVKINHLVEIAHNVRIGADTVIAGCSGVAGSTRIGRRCVIGGGVCIAGHISICDDTIIAGMSRVASSIKRPGQYNSGIPLQPYREWRKNLVHARHLNSMHKRIKRLEQARE